MYPEALAHAPASLELRREECGVLEPNRFEEVVLGKFEEGDARDTLDDDRGKVVEVIVVLFGEIFKSGINSAK